MLLLALREWSVYIARMTTVLEAPSVPRPKFPLGERELAAFCEKYRVALVETFTSEEMGEPIEEGPFRILVSVLPDAPKGLFVWVRMEAELTEMIGREVQMIERSAIEEGDNEARRRDLLTHTQVIYAV